MRLFYDHLLIDLDEVYAEIEILEITPKRKKQLAKIIDETSHHTVMDIILSHLDKAHHPSFLKNFTQNPHHPTHLIFLKENVKDIEDKIQSAIKDLKTTLLTELLSQSQ